VAEGVGAQEQLDEEPGELAAVDVAHAVGAAVGQEHRPAVEEPPQVALDAPEVVALAVHHGDADPGHREAVARVRLRERVLAGALADAVVPLVELVRILRLRDERPLVVVLGGGPGAAVAHEVDLPGGDHEVVADLAAEHLGRPAAVLAGERREVHHRVEGAVAHEPLEVLRPIAHQPLDAVAEELAEGVRERAPVEERDPVAAREEAEAEEPAHEAIPADHEDAHAPRL